tara:strand:+ start:835 stop:1362 length:528 start_codon:yes stop_codon:yes gene_type:complete
MHNLKLKKYYFVNQFNKNNIDNLENNTTIIYRNYKKQNDLKCIIKIRDYCRKKRIKFYISNNIKLSLNLKLDGAYIPSFNKSYKHLSYTFKKKFELIGSAHNIKEIKTKEIQKVKTLFLSSLFKKNKNYLGIRKFNNISKLTKKKVIALGGISTNNIKKLKIVKCIGFSGISYFE